MMRPLYREAGQRINPKGGNAGLRYDKFFDGWKADWSGLEDEGKKNWIDTVAGKRCGGKDRLQQATARMGLLLEAAGGQTPVFYKLESDFVTGLGREHPVENGFAWHHTLGTPYLPGSSVKGMVRAWAKQWEKAGKAELKRIFGSESKDDRDFRAGSVVFLDAIPTEPVRLKADIMTPHYAPYYQDETERKPPADWYSPIPIPFLVVEADAAFVFGILPRRKEDSSDCEKAREWLGQALEWTGAGAKTAVGYGRFALHVEAHTKGKSELYRELFEASVERNWRRDENAFSRAGVIEGWPERPEDNPDQDAEKLLKEIMRLHYADVIGKHDRAFRRLGLEEDLPSGDCRDIPEMLLYQDEQDAMLSDWGRLVWERCKNQLYGKRLLAPLPGLRYTPNFGRKVKRLDLAADRLATLNERLDELSLVVRNKRGNLQGFDFRMLTNNPRPPSTHECDIWSGGEHRLFGHYEEDDFVLDDIERGLH